MSVFSAFSPVLARKIGAWAAPSPPGASTSGAEQRGYPFPAVFAQAQGASGTNSETEEIPETDSEGEEAPSADESQVLTAPDTFVVSASSTPLSGSREPLAPLMSMAGNALGAPSAPSTPPKVASARSRPPAGVKAKQSLITQYGCSCNSPARPGASTPGPLTAPIADQMVPSREHQPASNAGLSAGTCRDIDVDAWHKDYVEQIHESFGTQVWMGAADDANDEESDAGNMCTSCHNGAAEARAPKRKKMMTKQQRELHKLRATAGAVQADAKSSECMFDCFSVTQTGDARQSDPDGKGLLASIDLCRGSRFYDPAVKFFPGSPPRHLDPYSYIYVPKPEGYFLLAKTGECGAFKSHTFFINEARKTNALEKSRQANIQYYSSSTMVDDKGEKMFELKLTRDVGCGEELVCDYNKACNKESEENGKDCPGETKEEVEEEPREHREGQDNCRKRDMEMWEASGDLSTFSSAICPATCPPPMVIQPSNHLALLPKIDDEQETAGGVGTVAEAGVPARSQEGGNDDRTPADASLASLAAECPSDIVCDCVVAEEAEDAGEACYTAPDTRAKEAAEKAERIVADAVAESGQPEEVFFALVDGYQNADEEMEQVPPLACPKRMVGRGVGCGEESDAESASPWNRLACSPPLSTLLTPSDQSQCSQASYRRTQGLQGCMRTREETEAGHAVEGGATQQHEQMAQHADVVARCVSFPRKRREPCLDAPFVNPGPRWALPPQVARTDRYLVCMCVCVRVCVCARA